MKKKKKKFQGRKEKGNEGLSRELPAEVHRVAFPNGVQYITANTATGLEVSVVLEFR